MMTTSFAVFMAFCVIGFDFMLYVLYQLQYGEKRARRSAAVRRRAGLTEQPFGNTNLPAPVAKARKPEIIAFLSPGDSAAKLYFAEGLGLKEQIHGFSRTRSTYRSLQAKSRNEK